MTKKWAFYLINIFILTGCFETNGVDAALMDTVSGRFNTLMQPVLPKSPEIMLVKGQAYVARDRDPMKSKEYVGNESIVVEDIRPPKVDFDRPAGYIPEPLELFSTSALKLLGTMRKKNIVQALIQDPDGIIHIVQIGYYLGNKFGRITKIQESFIEVEEKEFSAVNERKIIKVIISLEAKPL